MIYTTKPLRLEQTRKLATWQCLRNTRKRWMLMLMLPLIFLWVTDMPPQWAAVCLIAVYSMGLLLGWWRSRRVWAKECERFNTPGFLTITNAGVLIEYEGISSYYPWYFYKDATLVDEVLVLTLAGLQDICWNLEACTEQQRTELLEFARAHVSTDNGARIAPPRSVLTTTTVAQPETMAQMLEMGDIILAQRKLYTPWYWVVAVLTEVAFLLFCVLYGIECGFSDPYTWAFGIVIFAWFAYRGIRTLLHPGLPMLRRSLQAYGSPAGESCERFSDGHSEYIIYPDNKWIRADYTAMADAVKARHICVCHIRNITFAYPLGTEPALFSQAASYTPARWPLIITLLGIIPMLAMAGYALWAAPEYPFSFTVWFFTEYLF